MVSYSFIFWKGEIYNVYDHIEGLAINTSHIMKGVDYHVN